MTVTGTDFGEDGTLTVGGVEATIVDWSDTEIEAVVPEGAPNAWQDVVVTTDGGESTIQGLFVGVEYSGAADGLQDFILDTEPGTAVLLQDETYVIGSDSLFVDNVDLYGRGVDDTVLAVDVVYVLADAGGSAALVDLTHLGEALNYLSGTVRGLDIPVAVTAPDALDPHAALRSAGASQDPTAESALPKGRVRLERVLYEYTLGSGAPPSVGSYLPIPPGVDVTVRESQFVGPVAEGMFYTSGSLTIVDSTMDLLHVHIVALSDTAEVLDSDIQAVEMIELGADDGLNVERSTVTASNGTMMVTGSATYVLGGGGLPFGGPVTVSNSSLSAEDEDLEDGTPTGTLTILSFLGPVTFADNLLLRADSTFILQAMGFLGENDLVFTGNQDVRAGRVQGPTVQSGALVVQSQSVELPAELVVEGNSFSSTASVNLIALSIAPSVSFVDNQLALGSPTYPGTLVIQVVGEGETIVTGNTGELHQGALAVQSSGAGDITLSANEITFRETPNQTIAVLGWGTATVTDNTFTAVDPGAGSTAFYVAMGSEPLSLAATGNTFSGFLNALWFDGYDLAEVALDASVNGNVFLMEFSAAPQVARLDDIGDVIDAESNFWGGITDVVTLMSYVTLEGDTGAWGGGIDLDPVMPPL